MAFDGLRGFLGMKKVFKTGLLVCWYSKSAKSGESGYRLQATSVSVGNRAR
jgi:hypothetical protein